MSPEQRAQYDAKKKSELDAAAARIAAEEKRQAAKNKTQPVQKIPVEKQKPDLEVLKVGTKSEEFSRYVTGTIRNNTDHEYAYVQVEINLLDKGGSVVGSTLANMNNLEPRQTWKFKAVVMDEDVASFKVKDVTGY